MPRRPNERENRSTTPSNSSDPSSGRSEATTGNEQGIEGRVSTTALLRPEELLEQLSSTNIDLHEALEGLQRLRDMLDGATSRTLASLSISGTADSETPADSDRRMPNVGPSHSAIVLSPSEPTTSLEQLSSMVDELMANLPGRASTPTPAQYERTTLGTGARVRAMPNRQRSRSNVETQTTPIPAQGRTPPHRRSEILPSFRETERHVTLHRDDRRQTSSQDLSSTTLGRRVAARAASGRSQSQMNTSTEVRLRDLRAPPRAAARTSVSTPRNTLGIPMGNADEIASRSPLPLAARPSSTEDDSDFSTNSDLQHILAGLRSQRERTEAEESSDTETDEDLRFRRRMLSSASVGNPQSSSQADNERSAMNGTLLDAYRSFPVFWSSRGLPSPSDSTRRGQNLYRNAIPRVLHTPSQSTDTNSSTTRTELQTENSFIRRSPSPASLSDGGSPSNDQDGSFREVVETVQGSRSAYQVRRYLNARGEEQVHQIRASERLWDDPDRFLPSIPSTVVPPRRTSATERRPETWQNIIRNRERLRTRNERADTSQNGSARTRVTASTQITPSPSGDSAGPTLPLYLPSRSSASSLTSSSSSSSTGTRRRGWARLNADGDEIPTDEEEEIERLRTEQRLRNGESVFSSTTAGSNTMRARLEYLAPTTRSIFNYGLEDEDALPNPTSTARVRLNLPVAQAHRRVQQLAHEAAEIKSGKDSENSTEIRNFGTDVPYRLSPLPIPLMTDASPAPSRSSSRSDRRVVSRQSEIAGR